MTLLVSGAVSEGLRPEYRS